MYKWYVASIPIRQSSPVKYLGTLYFEFFIVVDTLSNQSECGTWNVAGANINFCHFPFPVNYQSLTVTDHYVDFLHISLICLIPILPDKASGNQSWTKIN